MTGGLERARTDLERSAFHRALAAGKLPRGAAVAWLRSRHAVTWRLHRAAFPRSSKRGAAMLPVADPAALRNRTRKQLLALERRLRPYDAEAHVAPFPAGPLTELLLALEGDDPNVLAAAHAALAFANETNPDVDPSRVGEGCGPRRVRGRGARRDPVGRGSSGGDDDDARLHAAAAHWVSLAGSLHPARDTPATSGALNPESGRHAISQDPRELAAALAAGARTWAEFPYYEARFGARGRRFTRADSAWLASLGHDPHPDRQLDWLASVLAARGMPTLLLETHLRNLYDALVDILPHRQSHYAWLLAGADAIATRRNAHLTDRSRRRLASAFAPPPASSIPRMGDVLVAALIDEASGLRRARESVLAWARDPDQGSEGWVAAVDATVVATDKALRRQRTSAPVSVGADRRGG